MPLKNVYGEDMELSTLLVKVTSSSVDDPNLVELQHIRELIAQKSGERQAILSDIMRTSRKGGAPGDPAVCFCR